MTLTAHHAQPDDYQELAVLWRASVAATHHFIDQAERDQIEVQLPTYFAAVELIKWTDGDQLVGFSGRQGAELVMLFLAPAVFRHGYGRQIIDRLDHQQPLTQVAVNEQNPGAYAFYQHLGFHVVRRSSKDDAGRPHPLLYLER